MTQTGGARRPPARTDTVIIGNGPSALALSFLLHGNVPRYDCRHPHPDRLLHKKLARGPDGCKNLYEDLRRLDHLTEHFPATDAYSDDAWPINVLLDALLSPADGFEHLPAGGGEAGVDSDGGSDADVSGSRARHSCVRFTQCDKYAQEHVVLGRSARAGGQWAEADAEADETQQAKTLSYREHLSLFGYTYEDFYRELLGDKAAGGKSGLSEDDMATAMGDRPRRSEVAAYYARYASRAGISDALYNETEVELVERLSDGGYKVYGQSPAGAFTTYCQRIVLATGLYTEHVEPPPVLARFAPTSRTPSYAPSAASASSLASPASSSSPSATPPTLGTPPSTAASHASAPASASADSGMPILVVGSGFSAADAVAEHLARGRRVVHAFRWHTANYTSPLKYCHRSSYPDYADVYRRMKGAALPQSGLTASAVAAETVRSMAEKEAMAERYIGLPDVAIATVDDLQHGHRVRFVADSSAHSRGDGSGGGNCQGERAGEELTIDVAAIAVMLGRRTNLAFLEPKVRAGLRLDRPSRRTSDAADAAHLKADIDIDIDIDIENGVGAGAGGSVGASGSDIDTRGGWLEKSGLRNHLQREGPASVLRDTGMLVIGSLTGDTLVRFGFGAVLGAAAVLLGK